MSNVRAQPMRLNTWDSYVYWESWHLIGEFIQTTLFEKALKGTDKVEGSRGAIIEMNTNANIFQIENPNFMEDYQSFYTLSNLLYSE